MRAMLIDSKFIKPAAARGFVHAEKLTPKLTHPRVLIQLPAGYLLAESLAAILEEEGQALIWLRFGPEDADPGICLLSMITALKSLNQDIGSQTFHHMQHPPGPVQGWPRLYQSLAQEVCASVVYPVRIVLENLHYLNLSSQTTLLLGRFFVGKLPQNFHFVFITHAQINSDFCQPSPIKVGIPEMQVSANTILELSRDFELVFQKKNAPLFSILNQWQFRGVGGSFQSGTLYRRKGIVRPLEKR